MSHSDELKINYLLKEAAYYNTHVQQDQTFEQLCTTCVEQADQILKKNIRDSFVNFSNDTIINFAETVVQIPRREELSEFYINLFFQRNQSKGQVYVRALLLKARLVALNGHEQLLKGEQMTTALQNSLNYVKQALDIISKPENKVKYGFLIYNTSVCVYNIIREYIKKDWLKNYTEYVDRLEKLFDEVDEPDYNWRCRYTWLLFQCLYDAEKKPDAAKILEKLWETTTKKKGPCNFQEHLFRLRIHLGREKEFSGIYSSTKKDADAAPEDMGWKHLYVLQQMKSGLIPEAQIEKELINVINSISSSILPGNEMASTGKLAPIVQERLAEAGRIALAHNLINIADSITNFLSRVRGQQSQKPYIMHEYNKAELYIKKAGPLIDNKTGMRLNSVQIKMQEVERRKEALKILEKVMVTNKKILDADLIHDGAILIWNIGLPFLNATYRPEVNKAFQAACQMLELIQSNEHALRVNFHLELAKSDLQEDYHTKANEHIQKALELDYSNPLTKIKVKYDEGEDLSLYQRPYDRYLISLRDKIKLKLNIYGESKTVIENVIQNLESVTLSKGENMRIEILQKSLGSLVNLEERDYYYDPARDLVQEEIAKEELLHKQQNLYQYKQKKLLAGEIAKLAFEWELNDLAMKACEFVVSDQWEQKNAEEMILSQAECYYIMASILIDQLNKENFEIAFAEPVRFVVEETESDSAAEEITNDKKEEVLNRKRQVIDYFVKGLRLAETVQQSWLIFNGAIYIWNNYLPVFRNPINDSKLLPDISDMLRSFFEVMKNSFKELEKKQIIDYDRDTKIQVNANIGLIYARLMEGKNQYDEVMRVCEALLQLPLGSHTRKLINSIKARVAGSAKGGGGGQKAADKSQAKAQKSAPEPGAQGGTSTEQVLFEVVQQLEIISNSANAQQKQELIKKCFETLLEWKAKDNDETELELHAELWARLARLALNEEQPLMYKYSLRCVENSLSLLNPNQDLLGIPASRLRWYSLAEYLYAENLLRMLNPDAQETESQEQLLFHALNHAVEGANKGLKAAINSLVLDAAKMVWNICAKLQDSAVNRKALIKPIFTTVFYLKQCKEKSEPDLILLLSQLIFKAALENEEYALGENVADMVFELIPKPMQKPIWEAKMIFMSKQGKNELQAISNMKEQDPSLQAKIWIRLARASNNTYKQSNSYNRAIEILKKENSIEIVEVYIEYSEWLLRNQGEQVLAVRKTLLEAADQLINIEKDDDEDDEEGGKGEQEKASTIFSHSTNKKSLLSRGSKKSIKPGGAGLSQSGQAASGGQQNKKSPNSVSKGQQGKGQTGSVSGGTKKADQKDKSKSNYSSRMSRSNVRVAKTIKSKQSKSIFSQREEDSNPDTLNCAHFERLFRIHAMLSQVSENQQQQIMHCMDAKFFLLRILDVSFQTLNQQEENAATYNKIDQQKKDAPQQQQQGSGPGQQLGKEAGSKQPQQQQQSEKKEGGLSGQQQQGSDEYFIPKYKIPTTLEEWIKLQFSKDFIEKTKTYEDYNFMGKFLFDKAELTFTYVDVVIAQLESVGLHSHCVPLLVFQRFFTREILGNNYLLMLQDFRFARLLHLLGFHTEADAVISNINVQKLKLTEHERKQFLARTESSRIVAVQKKTVDLSDQYIPKPNLVKEIPVYAIWVDIAKELYWAGDLIRSKDLFTEALRHAQVLAEKETIGVIFLYLGSIAYLEGEYQESLNFHQKSHKLIKKMSVWEISIQETFKVLKKLNKYDDIKKFLARLIEMFVDLLKKPTLDASKLKINQLLATLCILQGQVALKEMQREFSEESFKGAFEQIKSAWQFMNQGGAQLNHYQMMLRLFFKLQLFAERLNFCDKSELRVALRIMDQQNKQIVALEDSMRCILKYSLHQEKEANCTKTPLMLVLFQAVILLVSGLSTIGLLKGIMRRLRITISEPEVQGMSSGRGSGSRGDNRQSKAINVQGEQSDEEGEEKEDKVGELVASNLLLPQNTGSMSPQQQKHFEKVQNYILSLQRKIDHMLKPYPRKLESVEKSIAVLLSYMDKIPDESYFSVAAQVELARSKRLQAEKALKDIWMEKSNQQQQQKEQEEYLDEAEEQESAQKTVQFEEQDYKTESLNFAHQLNTEKLGNMFKSKWAAYYNKKYSLVMLENFGKLSPVKTFEFMAKYQHFAYIEWAVQQLKTAMVGKHKFVTLQRLIKHVLNCSGTENADAVRALTSGEFKLWHNIFNVPDYVEIVKSLLPQGSAYAILKLSEDKRFLYFSYMQIPKPSPTAEPGTPKPLPIFICKRRQLCLADHHKIDELTLRLNQLKSTLVKTPIIKEQDYQQLLTAQEKEYNDIFSELEAFSSFFTQDIDALINAPPASEAKTEEDQQQQQGSAGGGGAAKAVKDQKKDTKAAAGGKKGGATGVGKDEIQPYESTLPASKGGVESLVILLDTKLFALPFDFLQVFRSVPAVSRDFSLLLLGKRYKNAGFRPDLNNSSGIPRDRLKYIVYNFKQQQQAQQAQQQQLQQQPPPQQQQQLQQQMPEKDKLNADPVLQEAGKSFTTCKFEGVASQNRIASIGEWQKYVSQGSLILYFGNPWLMNILTPKLVIDMNEISNAKAMIVLDKINAQKFFLDKFSSLDPGGEKTPLSEQLLKSAALFSIIGIASMSCTQWAVGADQYPIMLDAMLKSIIGEENYFAASLLKYKEPVTKYFDQNGQEIVIEQQQQQKKDEPAGGGAGKKGGKAPAKVEEKQQQALNEDREIIEKKIEKLKLLTDNVLFVGVPVLRLG